MPDNARSFSFRIERSASELASQVVKMTGVLRALYIIYDLRQVRKNDDRFITATGVLKEILLLSANTRDRIFTHFALSVLTDHEGCQVFFPMHVMSQLANCVEALFSRITRTMADLHAPIKFTEGIQEGSVDSAFQQGFQCFERIVQEASASKKSQSGASLLIIALTSTSKDKWSASLQTFMAAQANFERVVKVVILVPIATRGPLMSNMQNRSLPSVEIHTVESIRNHLEGLFQEWILCPPAHRVPSVGLTFAVKGVTKWRVTVTVEALLYDPNVSFVVPSYQTEKQRKTLSLMSGEGELHLVTLVKADGICQSLIYGQPYVLRPSGAGADTTLAAEDNRCRFLALTKWMTISETVVIARLEGPIEETDLIQPYFVITSASEDTGCLLIQSIATRELLRPVSNGGSPRKILADPRNLSYFFNEFRELAESLPTSGNYDPYRQNSNVFRALSRAPVPEHRAPPPVPEHRAPPPVPEHRVPPPVPAIRASTANPRLPVPVKAARMSAPRPSMAPLRMKKTTAAAPVLSRFPHPAFSKAFP